MTLEEAQKVAESCATVDGGCPHCVAQIFERLAYHFPQISWFCNGSKIEPVKVMQEEFQVDVLVVSEQGAE